MAGASWQRCRVHFMPNALARVPENHAEMVAATIATTFAQPDATAVRAHLDAVAATLAPRFPAVAELIEAAKADLSAFADFPHAHWRKIWSTNPIERLNRECPASGRCPQRRTDVVQIFPNAKALLRLSACVLIEAHEEWIASDRRYLSEESMAALHPPTALPQHPAVDPAHAPAP